MKTFLQWLGGTADAGLNSFLLCLPTQRILFGAGEGTQRICHEHGIRIAGNTAGGTAPRLSSIWFSGLEWARVGGLPGFLCTVSDAGSCGVKLYGPRGLKHFVAAMRPFLSRPDFDLQVHELSAVDELGEDGWIVDGQVRIKPIVRGATGKKRPAAYKHVDRTIAKMFNPRNGGKFHPEVSSSSSSDSESIESEGSEIIGWWILCPGRPGKFDVDAARSLGVPIGPLCGQLQKGISVTLPNGRVVLPEQVLSEPEPTPLLLYLRKSYNVQPAPAKLFGSRVRLVAVVHDYVVTAESFITGTLNYTYHNQRNCLPLVLPAAFDATVEAAGRVLSRGCRVQIPRITPFPKENGKFRLIKPLMTLDVFPGEPEETLLFEPSEAQRLFYNSSPKPLPDTAKTTVTFLGTAGCLPGKYRNVSSIGVYCNPIGVLMDCGEGTFGQLLRARLALPRVICITHIHADHHIGLLQVLAAVQEARAFDPSISRITVVGPRHLQRWLERSLAVLTDVSSDAIEAFILSKDLHSSPKSIEGFTIEAFPVEHCSDAYGFRVASPSGASLVYSGDTVPCDAVIKAASSQCSLLIHECTMTDDLAAEASARRHSHFSGALRVIEVARPHKAVLTHFSQRYGRPESHDEMAGALRKQKLNTPVDLAFDFMQIDLK